MELALKVAIRRVSDFFRLFFDAEAGGVFFFFTGDMDYS
jgi:hypothetical protein